jgi:pyruvate dehydrogenase E2 component (dihydrolipoamide acetyltransferase)
LRIVVAMPTLSGSMESGIVSKWRVAVGEHVVVGQIIAEIESDKAVLEYESPEAGTVVALTATPGSEVPVGAPLLELETIS